MESTVGNCGSVLRETSWLAVWKMPQNYHLRVGKLFPPECQHGKALPFLGRPGQGPGTTSAAGDVLSKEAEGQVLEAGTVIRLGSQQELHLACCVVRSFIPLPVSFLWLSGP